MSLIDDIKKLRERTLCGFSSCKDALIESKGDIDEAVQILKKKGLKVADKRSGNETNEGIIRAGVSSDRTYGTIVRLLCETDFVARGKDFIDCSEKIVDLIVRDKIKDLEELNGIKYDDNISVNNKITELIGQCGENIKLDFICVEGINLYCYNHFTKKVSSIVDLNKEGDNSEIGKNIAMHIVACNPISVDRNSVDSSIIDSEKKIAIELSSDEINESIREKKVLGRLNKFYKENVLLEQPWIFDAKKNVGQILSENKINCINFFKLVKI